MTMQTNNTPLPDAGELTRQLIRQPTTLQAFRLPVASLDEAYRLLYASYSAEVIVRGGGGGRPMQPDAGTTQAVAQVARALWPGGKKPGLMLCGTVGNGKTTMLRAIQRACNWLWESGRMPPDMAAHDLDKVVVLTAKDIAQQAASPEWFGRTAGRSVLGIDDFGSEPAEVLTYGNVLTPIADLVEHRYARGLYTMVTTNLTGQEIAAKYGQRVADRLREMLQVVVFTGASYRQQD